ncbi:MAG: hypothetical protein KF757_05990 [Phycisphaeraceae bacterium]|nr:hypothetical protein [Phycisphaeraceae bacterium]MCW5763724.1 hypothetical protein [Phycisphaeraceae bacterium]
MISRKSLKREGLWVLVLGAGIAAIGIGMPAPTTIEDFFGPGTQPSTMLDPILTAQACSFCHGNYNETHEPYRPWAASMMGQAARDPLFHACLAIAEQDAPGSGDMCIRCHAPAGWLDGRSIPTDGSSLIGADFEGVSCNFCHRMVDPDYKPGVSPIEDVEILGALSPLPPASAHSGQYVMDPWDVRRGPRDLGPKFFFHPWLQSPFHQSASMCATCHDVSNPVYERQPDGKYLPGQWNAPAASFEKYDQFPLERTYSEWLMSSFASGPIDMGGRFGGNNPNVSTCQDCHMPTTTGRGCTFEDFPERNDLRQHFFNGGNTWVLQAVRNLYPDFETGLTQESVNDSIARAVDMLRNASDMELFDGGSTVRVRITNESGHKLPTGYPEGRRMWLNVKFFDSKDNLLVEHGSYDYDTAILTTGNTKVYEAKLGISPEVAPLFDKEPGESFHFVLNNMYVKDNRIPPRGFTNAGFEAIQAAPVAYSYADGQHWDDTDFTIPQGAARVEARLFYQTASKEYIDFLRSENKTNNAGEVAYEQWLVTGKSAPVEMDFASLEIAQPCLGDFNGDGDVNFFDVQAFLGAFSANHPSADLNNDGLYNFFDVQIFLQAFSDGCP